MGRVTGTQQNPQAQSRPPAPPENCHGLAPCTTAGSGDIPSRSTPCLPGTALALALDLSVMGI